MHYFRESMDGHVADKKLGMRLLVSATSCLVIVFALYGYLISQTNQGMIPIKTVQSMSHLALAVLLSLIVNLFAIGYGIYRLCSSEKLLNTKFQTNNPIVRRHDVLVIVPLLVNILSQSKRYRRLFIIALIIYAVLFAFISQIIIFRPDVSFSSIYGVLIPSWIVTPCCNFPGIVPTFTAYLSDNLIIYIIPVNLVLAIILSTLVSANIVLIAYSLQKKNFENCKSKKRSYFSGVGAMTGLFTACPICAGTFFSTIAGIITGASTVTTAVTITTMTTTTLASVQVLFVIISITMLIVSPYLIVKSIKKNYTLTGI
jgi:hypothetical protein